MLKSKKLQYCMLLLLTFMNGWFLSSFGPLIPHFSTVTGLDETHYSYIFFVRCARNIAGGFLIKYLIKKFTVQSLIVFNLLIGAFCLFLASLSLSTINLTLTIFVGSLVLVGEAVLVYDATIKLFLNDNPDYWLQFLGFMFGVGAMCGPFIVAIFKLHTFKVLALTQIIAICALMKYPLPNFIEQTH